jgi:hypothetical protein
MPLAAVIHKGRLQARLNFDDDTIVNIAFICSLLEVSMVNSSSMPSSINRDTALFLVRDVDEHLFFHSSDLRRSHQLPFSACRACLGPWS